MSDVQILADSLSPAGHRLTTFLCTFERYILAEVNTHRVFSRNSASSRAIPVQKMIERVKDNPVEPLWYANSRGMESKVVMTEEDTRQARLWWKWARDDAVRNAKHLITLGVHKSIVNRLLEPFAHITTLITATEWGNFYALRTAPDAQPEFRRLAIAMQEAHLLSTPTPLAEGEWHIPFGDRMLEGIGLHARLRIATARAARLSYLTFDNVIDPVKDYNLHDQLREDKHFSPFEHCARARADSGWSANFRGFDQYRGMVERGDSIT